MNGVCAQTELASYESRTRSVRIHGVLTTIKVENLFWQVLGEMAAAQGLTTNGLIVALHDEVKDRRDQFPNFASFLRVCCLRYLTLQIKRQQAEPGTGGASAPGAKPGPLRAVS